MYTYPRRLQSTQGTRAAFQQASSDARQPHSAPTKLSLTHALYLVTRQRRTALSLTVIARHTTSVTKVSFLRVTDEQPPIDHDCWKMTYHLSNWTHADVWRREQPLDVGPMVQDGRGLHIHHHHQTNVVFAGLESKKHNGSTEKAESAQLGGVDAWKQ